MTEPSRPTGIPITRTPRARAEADRIRAAVRAAVALPGPPGSPPGRLARPEDTDAFLAFLSDPDVHTPIYSLPRPLTRAAIGAFIADHTRQREAGEGLLFLRHDGETVIGYSDLQIWPDWGAGELAGAIHPARQSRGEGVAGARASFTWMFDALGLDLICETAAPDNHRTARLLDALGFTRMGEVTSQRPDGTRRASQVWEVSTQAWRARHAKAP